MARARKKPEGAGAEKAPAPKKRAPRKAAAPAAAGLSEALAAQLEGIVQDLGVQARALREEAVRGLEELRREAQAAREVILQAAREAAERLRGEIAGAEGEVGRAREGLREAGTAIGELTGQAEEVRRRHDRSLEQLRGLERSAQAARQQWEAAEAEARQARERLAEVRRQLEEAEATDLAGAEPGRAEPEAKNRLGVTVQPGVVVAEVQPGSAAAAAGLAPGDVIHSVNGAPVLTGPELRDQVEQKAPGDEIELRVMRGEEELHVSFRLEAGASAPAEGHNGLGVTVQPGVVVAEVLPLSPAASAGLARGDVIQSVNGAAVQSGAELRAAIEALEERAEATLHVTRAGEGRDVKVRLDEAASVIAAG